MLSLGFPAVLSNDVQTVSSLLPMSMHNNANTYNFSEHISYNLNGECIQFPYRVYLQEPSEKEVCSLTLLQKAILHCVFTRSCDGHVREKHIKMLFESGYDDWAIPYIVKISDEYVVELVVYLYEQLKSKNNRRFVEFWYCQGLGVLTK